MKLETYSEIYHLKDVLKETYNIIKELQEEKEELLKIINELTKENQKLKERIVNKELKELQKAYDRYNRILELSEALQEE